MSSSTPPRWTIVLLALLSGCAVPRAPERDRPGEAWVFRSVLDDRARMITVALDEEMWVAYDASWCSLYQAWKGGVQFEGAVYTTVHGPQPTTVGKIYTKGVLDRSVWKIRRGGMTLPVTADYRGYRLQDDEVTLLYRLPLREGGAIEVEETPEFLEDRRGRPVLRRTFRTRSVPPDVDVLVTVTLGELEVSNAVDTDGELELGGGLAPGIELVPPPDHSGRLRLHSDAVTVLDVTFSPSAVADAPPGRVEYPYVAAWDAERRRSQSEPTEAVLEIPLTLAPPQIDGELDALWSRSGPQAIDKPVAGEVEGDADLRAEVRFLYDLENLYLFYEVTDDRVINDTTLPFQDDAVEVYIDGGHERANYYDENDAQFIFGAGETDFWVTDSKNRYPGVEFATSFHDGGYRVEVKVPWSNLGVTAEPGRRIGLEVHVDDDDDGEEADAALSWFSDSPYAWSDPSHFATVLLGGETDTAPPDLGPREAGLGMRVYSIGRSMAELKRLVPGQTPNVNRVVPAIDLGTPQDFGGLEDHFVVELTGFLRVDEAGEHRFRLVSDDGSRLWIDNRPVVDHDGLHGAEPKEGRIELGAGEHGIRISYFENAGDQRLALQWKTPSSAEFTPIPADRLSTRAGEVRVTSPGHKRVVEPRTELRPGDTVPLTQVHPSYDLATIRPEGFHPRVGGLAFLSDGRLVVCTWDQEGAVYVLDGVQDEDPTAVSVEKVASGLAEPLGLAVVNDQIHVLQKQELTRLIDLDGDEVADEYRTVAQGWGVTANFHEFAFGLVHRDGDFYAALATAIDPGGGSTQPQDPDRGSVVRISPDGRHEIIARGLRTPNGIGIGVGGEIFVTDNQGDWLPASKLVHVREGAFFGFREVDPVADRDRPETPPVVWLPQGEIGNSPSEVVRIPHGPYAGQMLHGDVTHGGLKRVFAEKIDGAYQGAVFRFTQGLEGGVNRVILGPDGALYVGGIGSTGNWGQDGKERFGLQRLRFNGRSTFEILAVRAQSNGLELELTEEIPEGRGWDTLDYVVHQWRYEPTEEYGGPKIDEQELRIVSASVSPDRRRIFLELPGMREGHVVHVRVAGPVVSVSGQRLWSTEAWYTLNRIPTDRRGTVRPNPHSREPNTLSGEEMAAGFRLLFDGRTLSGWKGFRRETAPASWTVDEGALHFAPGGEGGDLATVGEFGSFELRLEWKVAEGGNSGIFFRVTEDHPNPWDTGPEMQVLDNARHPDGRKPATSAGANYALHAPPFDATRAAGLYNEVRLVVRGRDVEHWLNGYKVVEYRLGSPEWEKLVAGSKFSGLPEYGRRPRGRIVLQDHGDPVWFRSIRIRDLPDSP